MLSRRSILAGAGAAVIAAGPGSTTRAEAATGGLDRTALQQALDRIVATGATAALARVDTPNGSWRGSSGVQELGRPGRPAPGGRFRVGSITKTFVATVILQLAGEHRLSLADTLERWLPGLIPNGAGITVRHLLQHTSGIFNYTSALFRTPDDWVAAQFRTFQPAELVAIAAERPPNFEPGTSWSYSNTNYVLLGMIIQRVTGRPYAREVEKRILRPLRLHDTELPGTDVTIYGPHAHGYELVPRAGESVPHDFTDLNPSWAYAAGEIVSSTADLNRFYRALLGGRLLNRAALAEMLADPAGPLGYGLGIFRQPVPGGPTLLGHNGGIFGFVSYSFTTPDAATQITISVNPWPGDYGPAVLDLARAALGLTGDPAVRGQFATPQRTLRA